MRSARFGTKEQGKTAMTDSLMKAGQRKEARAKFTRGFNANPSNDPTKPDVKLPDEFTLKEKDSEMAGIVKLGYLNDAGTVDTGYTGDIQIGGLTHKISGGKMRLISDEIIENSIAPILQKQQYDQSLVSLCLSDSSDKIAYLLLGSDNFALLGDTGKPSYLTSHHTRSNEYGVGLVILTRVVRDASIIVDDERILKYLKLGDKDHDPIS